MNRALELDPDFPDAYFVSGIINTWTDWNWEQGEKAFLKALEYAERARTIRPGSGDAQMKLALMGLGRYDEAFEYRKKVLTYYFGEEFVQSFDSIFREEGYFATEKEIVRQFELLAQEKYVSTNTLASRHYASGDYSKALDDLEKGYELHEPLMPYLADGENGFVNLYVSTRFIAIVKKMNRLFRRVINNSPLTVLYFGVILQLTLCDLNLNLSYHEIVQ